MRYSAFTLAALGILALSDNASAQTFYGGYRAQPAVSVGFVTPSGFSFGYSNVAPVFGGFSRGFYPGYFYAPPVIYYPPPVVYPRPCPLPGYYYGRPVYRW